MITMSNNLGLTIIQIIIIIILFIVIIYMLRQNIALKHERRIGRYSIEPIKSESISVLDSISQKYFTFVRKIRHKIQNFFFIKKISHRYQKYILYGEENKEIEYIIHKFFIGIAFVLLTVFSQVLQTRLVTPLELLINFLIGYYILDLYLIYRQKLRIKQIENEMLRAIIIMNNAFKSGKSTLQAVKIAADELPEPISDEFKKMYRDMQYGLEIDTVFNRFAKRIDIEEARYLSSSLTILNRTGGNIVKVFSSIEKTLFDKKKLKEELHNLTVSPNLVVKVLMAIPFIFVAIIYLLNPSYFDPLFNSPIGYMVLALIVLMFIVYIWFLQKIMKVKV